MSQTLEVTKINAVNAYNQADAAGKILLENLFGKEAVAQKITDRVKSFGDACAAIGITVIALAGTADEIAYKKLKIIAKALNEGWEPNWKDTNEVKYFPWFEHSASGLVYDYVVDYHTRCFASSRLCYKSRELAEYAAKQFLPIYTDYLTIK